MRLYTYEIAPSANVGDALAIINTNLVSLDIAINNINSIYTDILTNFSNNLSAFDTVSKEFSAVKFLYSNAYGIVNTLSSYWQNAHVPAEFTLVYNIDVSRWAPANTTGYLSTKSSVFSVGGNWYYNDLLDNNNLPTRYSKGNGVDTTILKNLSASTSMCLEYLKNTTTQSNIFPSAVNTIAHIVLPVYNTLKGLNGVRSVNIPEFFSSKDRTMTTSFYKPRTVIQGNIIEHFQIRQLENTTAWISIGRTINL